MLILAKRSNRRRAAPSVDPMSHRTRESAQATAQADANLGSGLYIYIYIYIYIYNTLMYNTICFQKRSAESLSDVAPSRVHFIFIYNIYALY